MFNYLKSLSQVAKDLMDEIEDANSDIDYNKLFYIDSNKEKFNFNIFSMPLNFLSDIFNGKITLKKAEINNRNLNKKIEELKYNYKPKNEKEKEEIDEVLMHANDMLEYGETKLLMHLKMVFFYLNIFKKQMMLHMILCWKMYIVLFKKLNRWQKKFI